jgi:hypothetical protein
MKSAIVIFKVFHSQNHPENLWKNDYGRLPKIDYKKLYSRFVWFFSPGLGTSNLSFIDPHPKHSLPTKPQIKKKAKKKFPARHQQTNQHDNPSNLKFNWGKFFDLEKHQFSIYFQSSGAWKTRIINSICQKSDQPSVHFSNSNSYKKNSGISKHEKTFYEHLFQLFRDRFFGFFIWI